MGQNTKVMGIIGAVAGTILGLIVWCLIGMAGYISWIGGLAIAAGAFGGYKLLAKEIDTIGMVISAVLVIISVYIGTRMTYAIQIHQEIENEPSFALATEILGLDTDASTFEIFMDYGEYSDAYDEILENTGESFSGEFKKDLIFGYIVTAAAAVMIVVKMKKQ